MEAPGGFGPDLLGCFLQRSPFKPHSTGADPSQQSLHGSHNLWTLQQQSAMLKHHHTNAPIGDGFDFLGSMDFSADLAALAHSGDLHHMESGGPLHHHHNLPLGGLGGLPLADPASFFHPPTPPTTPPDTLGCGGSGGSGGSGSEDEAKPSLRDDSLLHGGAFDLVGHANPAPSHLFPLQMPPPPSAPASPQQDALGQVPLGCSGGMAPPAPEHKAKKIQHNAVERKYRNSINSRLEELKALLPPSRADERVVCASQKMNKASVLLKAIEHIVKLRETNKALDADNQQLRATLAAMTKQPQQQLQQQQQQQQQPAGSNSAVFLRSGSPLHSSSDEEEATSCGSSPASSPESAAGAATLAKHATAATAPVTEPASKKRKAAPESYGRLLMAVGLMGFCVFGSPVWVHTTGLSDGPSLHHTSRVLASADSSIADAGIFAAAAAALAEGWVWWWLMRGALFVAALSMIFRQEALETEPAKTRAAVQHEKKSSAILANGDHQAAQWHATQALLFLGRPQAATAAAFAATMVWEVFCQVFHRLAVYWPLNLLLYRSPPMAGSSIKVAVTATHRLHQLLLRQRASAGGTSSVRRANLAALQAVNLCESSSVALDPELRIRVYVAAAAQSILSSGTGAWLANTYLRQAQKVYRVSVRGADDPNPLSWVFHEDGHQFFQSGRWIEERMVTTRGQTLAPGELEQIGLSYRRHTLAGCVRALVKGEDPELVAERLGDLFQHSTNASDLHTAWWSMVILSVVHWRQGRPNDARGCISEVELLDLQDTTRLQVALFSTCLARQALLDGDQPLCWVASERAARILDQHCDLAINGDDLTRNVVFIAFRQLLACRLAIYRQRSYLTQQKVELPPLASAAGSAITGQDLLDSLRRDISNLSDFGEHHAVAQPLMFMYQAVHRCLVGGRTRPTEHLFHQAIKLARRLGLHFDHASVLLHLCGYMQATLTVGKMQEHLQLAAQIFERMDSTEELTTARKMLSILGDQ